MRIKQLIFGYTVNSNVREALEYIDFVKQENGGQLPQEIILQGFSRGADTCVRLANALYILHPEIKIKLFLVDHVAGPGRFDDYESYCIPPNVEQCDFNLMLNEHNKVFEPLDEDSYVFASGETRANYKQYVGNHGAAIAMRPGSKMGSKSSYELFRDDFLEYAKTEGYISKTYEIKADYAHNGKRHSRQVLADDAWDFDIRVISKKPTVKSIKKDTAFQSRHGLFLHDNSLYYFNRNFDTLELINFESLGKEEKGIYNDLFIYAQAEDTSIDHKRLQKLVATSSSPKLDDETIFRRYCNALSDLKQNCSRFKSQFSPKRNVLQQYSKSSFENELFFNHGHQKLFAKLYPELFEFLQLVPEYRRTFHKIGFNACKDLEKLYGQNSVYHEVVISYIQQQKYIQSTGKVSDKLNNHLLRQLSSALNHYKHLTLGKPGPEYKLYRRVKAYLDDPNGMMVDNFINSVRDDYSLTTKGYLYNCICNISTHKDSESCTKPIPQQLLALQIIRKLNVDNVQKSNLAFLYASNKPKPLRKLFYNLNKLVLLGHGDNPVKIIALLEKFPKNTICANRVKDLLKELRTTTSENPTATCNI